MIPQEQTLSSPIRIEPWPTEKPLTILAWIFAAFLWFFLFLSLFGVVYAVILGVFFFLGHVLFITHIRGNGIRLGPDQFSEIYESVKKLSERMGFKEVPEAYLLQQGGALNALATKLFRANLIVLYSDLLEACGDNHAARDMIIAHELGHLKQGHLKYHWFLILAYFIPFFGMALSRAREYTCDRYGLAGAGDKDDALVGLTILAAGAQRGPQVNREALVKQISTLNTGWMTIGEWLSTHPLIAKRVTALDADLKLKAPRTDSGVLRALGILALIFIVPTFLIGLATAGIALFGLSKKGGLMGFKTQAMIQIAKSNLTGLGNFVVGESIEKGTIPKNQEELYQHWLASSPENKELRDPFSHKRYEYDVLGGQNFIIWSNGPDQIEGTEDDIRYPFR